MKLQKTWRFGALASAVALLGSLASVDAHALALGRVTVLSALGETLRAEIDIAEINAEEASSLRVGIASSEAFKAAGLEYSATVTGLQISLQKRPDGRSFLRLSSPRAVTEPFVDLVVEANWSSGRVVRDYTLLFDPPNLRQAIGPTSAPGLSSAPGSQRPPAAALPRPAAASGSSSDQNVRPVPMARAARPASAPPKTMGSGQQVVVKQGDTAGKIASQGKPAGVSLDQMLVALLSSNPDAFINGNINRLKSGAVLEMPSEQDAAATPAGQASQTILAQSKNFNNFRRKLAESAPAAQVAPADRKADGKLQAKVDDAVPGAKPPDKLTLSKGAVQSKALAEEKIAKDRQALSESTRIAELSKNISDLDKLKGTPAAAGPAGSAAAASAAKGGGVIVPAPAGLPGSLPAAAPAATASAAKVPSLAASLPALNASAARPAASAGVAPTGAASAGTSPAPNLPAPTLPASAAPAPAASASASIPLLTTATTPVAGASPTVAAGTTATTPSAITPSAAAIEPVVAATAASAAAAVPAKKAIAVPPAAPAPSLIDDLIGNEFTLPGLAALLALLGGFVFYRNKKKNNPAAVDSSFLESRLQPDSFFGASGGQRVDTSESSASGSSLVYSPSQLDAAGDVDPVAEADVYLAYGRDLQAEEILKEALRTTPARVAIHAKLAEIYSKRRDIKGFESVSTEAFSLTNGSGPEWSYITELGRELDPGNGLYKPGGQPVAVQATAAASSAALAGAFGSDTIPVPHLVSAADAASVSGDVDFDLDLDVLSDSVPVTAQEPTVSTKLESSPAFDSGAMDFNDLRLATQPMGIKAGAVAASASDSSYSATQPLVAIKAPTVAAPAPAAVLDSGMMEFDLGSLSLDLEQSSTAALPSGSAVLSSSAVAASQSAPHVPVGPLETKFALAEEFRALGDPDGARALANEVVADAQGALKTKAQAFLNSLM